MIKRITISFLLGTALLISLACGPGAKETKEIKDAYVPVPETIVNENVPPIPVEISEKLKQYSDLNSAGIVDWDPRDNGMIVATRRGETTQLCRVDKPMGELKQLTDYKEPVTTAVFSPDPSGNYFVFSKDVGGAENYQLFQYRLDTGEAFMITDGKSRHMGTVFNSAGDRIAYSGNSRTGMLFDVYVMDPGKPAEAKMVYQAQRPAYLMPTGWLPDNRHLLVVEYLSANEANTILVDTETGKSENITPKSDTALFFALQASSEDGAFLFGITDRDTEFQKLVRFERATSAIKTITSDIPWDVEEIRATNDRKKMAFSTNEGGINRLYLMDVETLKYKAVPNLPGGLLRNIRFDSTGKRLFVNINNARMNSDAFEFYLETEELKRWTRSDTAGLDLEAFAMPELIEFPTFDSVDGKPRMIPAYYYRPTTKSDKPHPVVIDIHGGPEGQFRPRFQGMFNYLTNELGIAVIAPNVRGSSGYGKSYLLMDNWEKREDSVKDIGALLDWVAGRPELDKDRVAVFGGSYGGYMVLASMVHFSDRLACGVDIVGISNFVTFLENTSAYRRDLRRVEYGDERKIGEFLDKISPSTNAHKIKKPLFVIQGKNDPRVPASEAEQIVKTVRENNVPVWYQLATNEGHGFRKKYNRDFMYFSVIRFFQQYLLKVM